MSEFKTYLQSLFNAKSVEITGKNSLIDAFIRDENNLEAFKAITENQAMLLNKWELFSRINDIKEQSLLIPNATVNKYYEVQLDFDKLAWTDVIFLSIEGLTELGLDYDIEKKIISGIPEVSGDVKLLLKFRIQGEKEDSELNEKTISFIVNPNPKLLWKDIPSDHLNQFWKSDEEHISGVLGDKRIVVASKRGRSHANTGSFRDDDFAFNHFENNGWSIVAVSDGAGSAKLSRKGSQIACTEVVNYFSGQEAIDKFLLLDVLIEKNNKDRPDNNTVDINMFVYDFVGNAALNVFNKVSDFARQNNNTINDLHATLVFTLFKKFNFGYILITFSVGDCPIVVLSKDLTDIKCLNKLDVGEFGGGTRFITMPEIFQNGNLSSRLNFTIMEDFSYLMVMTDGIYDPKFEVEANLVKIDRWKSFLDDLKGNNEDACIVDFDDYTNVSKQLANWINFWSIGNHDDRTLAIIY